MIVHHVYFSERRTHLTHLSHEAGWQGSERDVTLFEIYALLSERNEEITASVWIDDRLQSDF